MGESSSLVVQDFVHQQYFCSFRITKRISKLDELPCGMTTGKYLLVMGLNCHCFPMVGLVINLIVGVYNAHYKDSPLKAGWVEHPQNKDFRPGITWSPEEMNGECQHPRRNPRRTFRNRGRVFYQATIWWFTHGTGFTGCSEVREVREVLSWDNQTPHHISNDKVMPEETELYTGRRYFGFVEPFYTCEILVNVFCGVAFDECRVCFWMYYQGPQLKS